MRYAVCLALAALLSGCSATPEPGSADLTETPVPALTAPSPRGAKASASTPARATAKPHGIPNLKGETRNAWAFAPLAHPDRVTVEGSVPLTKAYSTSKVLVVCAFLATVAHGDPGRLTSSQRGLVERALTRSDMSALLALERSVPGGPQGEITRILRRLGDARTSVPPTAFGSMLWSPREQVRFMAALANGRVVSPRTSRYVLRTMKPVASQRWGLGTIGASAFKGGWLRAWTDTRQMGIVDGYAVAIITYAVGLAALQSDGDSAHVQQMNRLAGRLRTRLDSE